MKNTLLFLYIAQTANPLMTGATFHYGIIKRLVTAAAERMPEEQYAFRPAEATDVRTFAQFVAHLADSNYRLCSIIAGEDPPKDSGIERTKTQKAELVRELSASFAYCDQVHAKTTDTDAVTLIRFEAGGEGTRAPLPPMPKLTAFAFHVGHAFEHYGNMVTYMRMKDIVPPSSALPPRRTVTATVNPPAGNVPYRDVSGPWLLTVDTPNGPVTGILNIQIDGSTLKGEADTDRGVIALSGTLSPTEITLTGVLQTLRITFSGKPSVQSMNGPVNFGGRNAGTWTAQRP